ncbi:winged helix-turn-helix transcriptional regulator [Lysinibacillus pakistanensis]
MAAFKKDAGKSNREIARILGVSEATIRRRLKETESKF